MAIEKMMAVNIIGRLSDLNSVLETCCEQEDFHPERAISYLPVKSGYTQLAEENPYAKYMDKFNDLAKRMKIEFSGTVSGSIDMSPEEISAYADDVSGRLEALTTCKKELTDRIDHDGRDIDQLIHFRGFDLNLGEIFKSQFIKVRFGRLPNESFNKLAQYEDNPYIIFFPCESDDRYHWGVYFSPLDEVSDVDRIFSNLYFERLRIPDAAETPELAIEHLTESIAEAKKLLSDVEADIKHIWDNEMTRLSHTFACVQKNFNLYSMRAYAAKYKDYFHIIGFVPARKKKSFEMALSRHAKVEFSIEKPGEELKIEPPVLLKNNLLAKPYEMYTEMYGLPGYHEIDPTFFVALTYSIIFGVMFADVGQGLMLILFGWFLHKKKGVALGGILARCGIFSTIFGALFGSVFGFEELLDGFYRDTLGISFLPFKPMHAENITSILIMAVAIGVVLVIVAMLLGIFVALRQKRYQKAFFDSSGVTGLVFYVSLLFMVIDKILLKTGATGPPFVALCIILPIILLFFREPLGHLAERKKDWMPENWGEFFLQNIFEMFEIMLSFVTNTLSFLRIGAFVLVHAGMMMVVFILAGDNPLVKTLVLIGGNIFVIGMEGLLVGIQSLRLEFYEMFSRFFEGTGHPFKPVK